VKASAAVGSGEDFVLKVGDAYDLLDTFQPASIDAVLTSPPYWGHRSYDQSHNWEILKEWHQSGGNLEATPSYDWYRRHGGVLGLEPLPEWYVFHLVEIFEKVKDCLKPSGNVWINIGDTYFARWSSIRENGRQGLGDQTDSVVGGQWEDTVRKNSSSLFRRGSRSRCRTSAGFFATTLSGISQTFLRAPNRTGCVSATSTSFISSSDRR
jgi:DNA modification methylase